MVRRRETAKKVQEMKDIHNISFAHIAEMTKIPYSDVHNLYRLKLDKINLAPNNDEY